MRVGKGERQIMPVGKIGRDMRLLHSERGKDSQQEVGEKGGEDKQTDIDSRHRARSAESDGSMSTPMAKWSSAAASLPR